MYSKLIFLTLLISLYWYLISLHFLFSLLSKYKYFNNSVGLEKLMINGDIKIELSKSLMIKKINIYLITYRVLLIYKKIQNQNISCYWYSYLSLLIYKIYYWKYLFNIIYHSKISLVSFSAIYISVYNS